MVPNCSIQEMTPNWCLSIDGGWSAVARPCGCHPSILCYSVVGGRYVTRHSGLVSRAGLAGMLCREITFRNIFSEHALFQSMLYEFV